jgi:hypothetical protein
LRDSTRHERVETSRFGPKFIRLKSGRLLSFWDAITAGESAQSALVRAFSRSFKLAADDWDLERIEYRIDGLELWIAAVRAELEKRRGVQSQKERIALLRNTTGRTPEEAEAFLRKADELEERMSTQ